LSDSALFTSGSLFTTDYLVEAIRTDHVYTAVDVGELRAKLGVIASAFPQSHKTNESQTEDDFIWPVLAALGWTESLRQQNLTVSGRDDVPDGLLFVDAEAKAAANAQGEQWKRYAHGLAVVESKRWARPLDRASGRDEATAPSTQMLRYLRRIDDLTSGQLRWGILTNGTKWRLYWAGARSVSEEFLEIDLGRVLALEGGDDLFADEATRDHWLRVFAALFCRDAFIKTGTDNRSFHERARAAAAFYEERVAASLSKLVFEQVFPNLASAIAQAAPQASLEDVRQASLVLLYRLLFLLYAEDRDLLPVGEKRYDDYALRHQRKEVGERVSDGDVFSASAGKIWAHVADLARIIDKGDASVGIPPYNGGLFAGDGTPLLDSIRIPDSVMAPALDALSYERASGERRYINYRDLSVQQLGSIYERLLEFEIVRDDAGVLAVRPNLFARKNSGSYYTPDELVGLILDQTLEPLIKERLDTFRAALGKLDPKDSEDYQRRELADADPAEAILKLRVCDPAMGSGHFLVSLVDTLADHVLDAMAEAAALASDLAYASPLATKIEDIRRTILKNARDANWTIDEAQLDDRHIVRRMVLKRCVYGVDKNPMAVELAKVALWLHTFTVGAPLSFIDHHLRAGDSLFGLWVRDAIDKAGAQGGELLHIGPLREAESSAAAMQIIERLTDAEIAEAHQSASTWYGVQSQIAPLDSFVSFLHALDWLNLKQPAEKAAVRAWLDGQYGDPILIMLGKVEPAARKSTSATAGSADRMKKQRFDADELFEHLQRILGNARGLIAEERFLNWQVAFPGVWEKWSGNDRTGGFDAVVGNPPWDRIKLQQVEWFAARRPEIALAQRASDRGKLIAKLKADGDPLWDDFAHADIRAADTARMARASGNYPLLSGGDTNLNSLFVERAHALVKTGGMVGLLIPSGIASDQSSSAFFRKVTGDKQVHSIVDFFNRRYDGSLYFPDVYYRFKFCAYVAGGPGRTFESASFGFFIRDLAEIADPDIDLIGELEGSIVEFDKGLAAARGRQTAAGNAVGSAQRPVMEPFRLSCNQAQVAADDASRHSAEAQQKHRVLLELQTSLADELKNLQSLEQSSGSLRGLAEAFDGQNELRTSLETFAIGAMFDQVLEAANLRLDPMTSGRYRFERDTVSVGGRSKRGLDVRVHDIETGRAREIITLSGGETFIAALSLALGLSDIVEMTNGAIRLDTIFIDEGFGSLDTENDAGTLDQVLQVLQNIVGERRAVGLISHVPLVQQAVPNGFTVHKGVNGSQIAVRHA